MKILIALLFSSFLLCFLARAEEAAPPAAKGGVEDGTCWKDADGNKVSVDVRGSMHGDQKVTMTLGDSSASTTGTPAAGGGCLTSGQGTLGDHNYKVDDGKLKRENATGSWITMQEVDCPPDDEAPSEDDLGTLPGVGSFYTPQGPQQA